MQEQNLERHTRNEHGLGKVLMKDQPTIQQFFAPKRKSEAAKDTPNKKKKASEVFEDVSELDCDGADAGKGLRAEIKQNPVLACARSWVRSFLSATSFEHLLDRMRYSIPCLPCIE